MLNYNKGEWWIVFVELIVSLDMFLNKWNFFLFLDDNFN